jgi:hypothetical protein
VTALKHPCVTLLKEVASYLLKRDIFIMNNYSSIDLPCFCGKGYGIFLALAGKNQGGVSPAHRDVLSILPVTSP